MLREMVSDHSRPFYNLGDITNIGPVPRRIFLLSSLKKFSDAGYAASNAVVSRMLDLAQDVPYNVQALASHCCTG